MSKHGNGVGRITAGLLPEMQQPHVGADSCQPCPWIGDMQAHFFMLENVPVNYGIRFSDPVTALTARRVRYGVGPDLICLPGPSPGIKTHSSPAAFPTTLSLPFVPFPSLSPACTAPSCLKPRRAPPTP